MKNRKIIYIIVIILAIIAGIYKYNNYISKNNVSTNVSSSEQSKKALIKGNINSKGEKIYHMPGQQFYDVTDAEQYFKTEQEAQDAGFRKSKK